MNPRSALRLVAWGGAALLLGAGAWFVRDRFGPGREIRAAARELSARREEARRAGLPLEVADMDGPRKAGLAAFDAFCAFDRIVRADRALRKALDVHSDKADAGAMLLAKPGAVDALLAASKIERVDLPVPWSEGVVGPETDYGLFSRYVTACCALAEKRHAAHDEGGAMDWLKAGSRICSQLVDEPSFRAVPAWSSCTNRVLRTLYSFVRSGPSFGVVLGAPQVLDAMKVPHDLSLYAKAECLRGETTARRYDTLLESERRDLQLQTPQERIAPPMDAGAGAALEANALAHWARIAALSSPKDGDLLRAGIAMDDEAAKWLHEDDPASFLSRCVGRTFESTGISILRVEQMKRLVATALEAAEYFTAHGRFPDSLADGEGHLDPVGRAPFVYLPTRSGFALLAVGQRTDGRVDPALGDLRLVPGQGYALSFGTGD